MFKKKLYSLPLFLMILFCLVGCNKGNGDITPTEKTGTGTAYGIVHNGYVGMAKVTIKDDKVTDVVYDEAFLPHTWANVDVKLEEGASVPDDVLVYTKDEMSTYYAKYITIEGEVFTGTLRESDLVIDSNSYPNQMIKYSSDKIPDLFAYLYNNDKNCEWYFNAVKNKRVFISDKDGKKLDTYPSLNTNGWFKSEGKYWTSSESSPLGWKGNVDAMINYLKGKALTALDNSKFVQDTTGEDKDGYNYKYWTIDGTKTYVTWTDAYNYYNLAYKAYDKAKANAK